MAIIDSLLSLKLYLESGAFGFKYSKNILREHILDVYEQGSQFKVGVAVYFKFKIENDRALPYLEFKRVEFNQAIKTLTFVPAPSIIMPEYIHISKTNREAFNSFYLPATDIQAGENIIEGYDFCIFSKSQLDTITMLSTEVIFSGAKITYMSSAYFPPASKQSQVVQGETDYFTLKLEGETNGIGINVTSGSLPIIQVAAPCPPNWRNE